MSRFFAAYDTYDIQGMLSLHTDDAVWTWVDPGKHFKWGPEGKLVGKGKEGIRKLFEMDRGKFGFTGYILWSDISGDTVETIEIWQNELSRKAAIPVIAKSRYRFLGDKIAEWTFIVSPESSRRWMEAATKAKR
jgi:ketosteroid isomerase-like protein